MTQLHYQVYITYQLHVSANDAVAINRLDTSQMKQQLDATLYRFYFCRVTLHVSGASAYHQEYLKLVQRPLVHVLSLQVITSPY